MDAAAAAEAPAPAPPARRDVRAPYPMQSFYSLLTFLLIILSFIVGFVAMALIAAVTYPFVNRKQRRLLLGRVFRLSNYVFPVLLNPAWSLRVRRTPDANEPPSGTAPAPELGSLYLANHLSNADPFFLCSALWPTETKYIAKASLFKLPFAGWSMSMVGDLPVHFTSEKGGWGTKKGSVAELLDACRQVIRDGENIAAFPEGQRSFDGTLGEFKDGMFSLAVEMGCSVVPVAIAGSEVCWPRGTWKVGRNRCEVLVGRPISAVGESVESLKAKLRAAIVALQAQLPPTQFERRTKDKDAKAE